MPMPKVYMIPQDTPNAFATGRNEHNAAVAVTGGIVRILNEKGLRGALAHELAHIKNPDILSGLLLRRWPEPSRCWPICLNGQ